MTAILMFIITDSVYIFNAVAQTNETDIETNRIIDRQRTPPSSGENPTDDVGNAPLQTNPLQTNPLQTNPLQTNETDIETNETDIETNETDIETNRIIIRQRTPLS